MNNMQKRGNGEKVTNRATNIPLMQITLISVSVPKKQGCLQGCSINNR